MRWLRTQRDLIGLIAVWGILLQSLALPFSSGLHAAAKIAGDADFALLCSTGGMTPAPDGETQRQGTADCPCSMACHAGCASACGGLLPGFARAILPGDGGLAAPPSFRDALSEANLVHHTYARAPPIRPRPPIR